MRYVALGTVLIVFSLIAAPAALAHDDVVGTSPGNGERLSTAPEEVRIEFSEDANPRSGTGSITGPDGGSLQVGPARIDGTVLVIPMRPATTEGHYTADFRTVSADGHPVAGSVTFQIVEERASDTRPPPTSAAPEASEDTPFWPWVIGAAVAGIGAVALLHTINRSTRDDRENP